MGGLSIYSSTTTSLTTGAADTCEKVSMKHIRSVYKLDGQIYSKELNKKNRGILFLGCSPAVDEMPAVAWL